MKYNITNSTYVAISIDEDISYDKLREMCIHYKMDKYHKSILHNRPYIETHSNTLLEVIHILFDDLKEAYEIEEKLLHDFDWEFDELGMFKPPQRIPLIFPEKVISLSDELIPFLTQLVYDERSEKIVKINKKNKWEFTGFLGVTQKIDNDCMKGYSWQYTYIDKKGIKKHIQRIELYPLMIEVRKRGLKWGVTDPEHALKICKAFLLDINNLL